jgi:hypothetical protein
VEHRRDSRSHISSEICRRLSVPHMFVSRRSAFKLSSLATSEPAISQMEISVRSGPIVIPHACTWQAGTISRHRRQTPSSYGAPKTRIYTVLSGLPPEYYDRPDSSSPTRLASLPRYYVNSTTFSAAGTSKDKSHHMDGVSVPYLITRAS